MRARGTSVFRREPAQRTGCRDLYSGNTKEFMCCTPEQFEEWKGEDGYMIDNERWEFCGEAYRPACLEHRKAGRCIRSEREWWKLMRDDAERL